MICSKKIQYQAESYKNSLMNLIVF